MRIHILGVGGTFMGSLAVLAKQMGYDVTGVDGAIYEPMASFLRAQAIETAQYEDDPWLQNDTIDMVVIGNALSRGHPSVEWVLNHRVPYTSGPAWLADQVLASRRVIAVAGTHGKTTTSALLSWLMTEMGYQPGYLIGGVPRDLPSNVSLGQSEWFVVEADEYDSAFFDKRPKFMHYRPDILIINNIEYDHADIYPSLESIIQQFGYLLRTVPANGHVVVPASSASVKELMSAHPWSQCHSFGAEEAELALTHVHENAHQLRYGKQQMTLDWPLLGEHNRQNCQAALLALSCLGADLHQLPDLNRFQGPKRRLQCHYDQDGLMVFEDFGHHPTAIKMTLQALRERFPKHRLTAIVHMGSNSMKDGAHDQALLELPLLAETLLFYCDSNSVIKRIEQQLVSANAFVISSEDALVQRLDPLECQIRILFSNKGAQSLLSALLPTSATAACSD